LAFLQRGAARAVQWLEFSDAMLGMRVARDQVTAALARHQCEETNMDWNDLEQDTPSIRSLLYDRGGLLFEEQTSLCDYDEPADDWTDELPEEDV
jgi:hypothetical protein